MQKWTAPALLGVLLAAVSCSAGKSARSDPPPPPAAVPAGELIQTGMASWYGDGFHGRLTANGEIYDMNKLTAAHQTLPFHTLLEVENLENGRKVLVRINDRGPFLKERIVDLSRQAAQRLGIIGKGTALVALRLVRWQTGPMGDLAGAARDARSPADRATGETEGACCVQAGAFGLRENAEDLLATLAEIDSGVRFGIVVEDGLFKVISAGLPAAERCQAVIERLAAYHLPAFSRTHCQGKLE